MNCACTAAMNPAAAQPPNSRLKTCCRKRSHTGGAGRQIGTSMPDAAAKLSDSLTPSLATSGFAQMSPVHCEMNELGAEVERCKLCCLLSRERNQNTDRCDCIGSETECLRPEEHM